jgi:hypothetical protein
MTFLSVSEQSAVILLLEEALFSWPLAMDERGGYEDLRGSGRRSVIHTSMGELSCIARACLSVGESVFDTREEVYTRFFYRSKSDSYNETRGPTGSPKVVETLYNI